MNDGLIDLEFLEISACQEDFPKIAWTERANRSGAKGRGGVALAANRRRSRNLRDPTPTSVPHARAYTSSVRRIDGPPRHGHRARVGPVAERNTVKPQGETEESKECVRAFMERRKPGLHETVK